MASISREKNGRRTIQFIAPNGSGKRKSIRLGKVSKRDAETIRLRVESLVCAQLTRHAVDDETARWVANLDNSLADKLARVGLTCRRERATLAAFLTDYIGGSHRCKAPHIDEV